MINEVKKILLIIVYMVVYCWIYGLVILTLIKVEDYEFSENMLIKSAEGVFFFSLGTLMIAGVPLFVVSVASLWDYLNDK